MFPLKSTNNIKYKINLYPSGDKIKLEAESDSEEILPKKIYATIYSLKEFSEDISPIFKSDDIISIEKKLNNLFNNNNIKLYEGTNFLKLEFLENNNTLFSLQMEEIKSDVDTSLDDIYSLIKGLKMEIKTLKNEHDELKEKHNDLKKEHDEIKKE